MIPEAYYPLQKSTFKKEFVYLFIFDAYAQMGKPSSQKWERMEFPCPVVLNETTLIEV